MQTAQTAPQITVNVSAMDSQSFLDHSTDISEALVREAMLNMHPINDVVASLDPWRIFSDAENRCGGAVSFMQRGSVSPSRVGALSTAMQSFALYGAALRRWVVCTDLLDETEPANVIAFAEQLGEWHIRIH